MTNTDMNRTTATATTTTTTIDTGVLEAPRAAAEHDSGPQKTKGTKKRSRARRRVAKALAYSALVLTGLLVLAEPWLLIPIIALVLAISLWD
ncbi:hypothetical protein ACWGE1_09595 [Streptomyces sp. NPDC054932]